MSEFKHAQGLRAKDKLTGFEGIITCRLDYLTGCNRYYLQPTEVRDGKPAEGAYFDEAQIEIIDSGVMPEDMQGDEKGACAPYPNSSTFSATR